MNEEDGQFVFIPELNTFGIKVSYEIECDNWNEFYSVFDLDGLNRLLKTQLDSEKYEAAEEIKKHINERYGNKNN